MNLDKRIAICLCLGSVLLLGGVRPMSAQGISIPIPGATRDTAPSDRQPAAVPVADIPIRADRALSRLRSLQPQLQSDADVADVRQRLPEELEALSMAHDRVGQLVLENLSLRELTDLRQAWRRYQERLSRWKSTLESEWQKLGDAFETVDHTKQTWTLTRSAQMEESEPPSAILARIDELLASADDVESVIRRQMESLLGLEAQIDEALSGATDVLREIGDAEQSVRARTFTRNAPPLWLPESWTTPAGADALKGGWREEAAALRQLVEQDGDRMLLQVLIFFLLLALALRLRARFESQSGEKDPTLEAAAETLSHPVSASLLLTVLLSGPLYPRATFTVEQMLGLVVIVPVYRLLPRSRLEIVNRSMRMLLLLILVDGLAELLLEASSDYRFLTLLLAVVISTGATWLVRNFHPAPEAETVWGRVVLRALQVSIAVSALAIVSNVLGWTLLASTLVGGLLGTAFIGLGTVIALRVLAGMVRLLPYSRLGSASLALAGYGDVITNRIIRVLKLAAFPVWIWLSLQYLELDVPVGAWLQNLVGGSIQIGILSVSLQSILYFGVTLLLTVWLARLARFVLDVEVLPRFHLERGVSSAVSTVTQWTILGLGLLAAASAAGLGASQLALVAGALGVGIGFGLQNIVNNFVSGLILVFEQPVKVGDKVEITSLALTGEVRRIGIRSSIVRSFDGAEVIVPNANLISSEVVNWTLSDQRRRVHTEVGVAYGTDPHRVIEILKRVADTQPEVLAYPAPQVLFLGFGESSLNFRLLSWTGSFDDFLKLRSELAVATHDALKQAGIEIPFPQRDLHVKTVSPGSSGASFTTPDEQSAGSPGPAG